MLRWSGPAEVALEFLLQGVGGGPGKARVWQPGVGVMMVIPDETHCYHLGQPSSPLASTGLQKGCRACHWK